MEALLLLLLVGAALLVPVGSLLGLLAFRASRSQADRVETLGREVSALRQELAQLKNEGPSTTKSQAQPPDLTAPSREQSPQPEPVHKPAPAGPASIPSPEPRWAPPPVPRENPVVAALKENWMVWLGALSVSLAGIFMVSHSINAGLIGPAQQLLMALASGLALHAGAEFMRRRHMGTDQVFAALAGGGSITLYAAMLAGVHLFDMIGPVTALVALALVSLATMLLALVHGPLLAVMGLSGAYLVPLLVGGEGGNVAFLLGYSFVITVSSLLLMRFVFRIWLWYATLAGALLWWLLVVASFSSGLATASYLSALFVLFSVLPRYRLIDTGQPW